MLNFDLIKQILIIAMGSSIVTTATVQKIKEMIKNKKFIWLISFLVSMILGTAFSYCFSELSFINCIWTGFLTFLGADTIYKAFEDKIFTSFKDMKNVTVLERNDNE